MKKLFAILSVMLLVFAFSAPSVLAGKSSCGGNGDCVKVKDGSCNQDCPNYADENGDGVCDNCPDDDGDGIPNCQDDDYRPPKDGSGKKKGKCGGCKK